MFCVVVTFNEMIRECSCCLLLSVLSRPVRCVSSYPPCLVLFVLPRFVSSYPSCVALFACVSSCQCSQRVATWFFERILISRLRGHESRKSSFHAAQVGKDLARWRLTTDGPDALMETGARQGVRLARRLRRCIRCTQE